MRKAWKFGLLGAGIVCLPLLAKADDGYTHQNCIGEKWRFLQVVTRDLQVKLHQGVCERTEIPALYTCVWTNVFKVRCLRPNELLTELNKKKR
jgi:hypothetical protein